MTAEERQQVFESGYESGRRDAEAKAAQLISAARIGGRALGWTECLTELACVITQKMLAVKQGLETVNEALNNAEQTK